MKTIHLLCLPVCLVALTCGSAAALDPTSPLVPDDRTLLLYHFDDGQGTTTADSSGHGYDGDVRGATWVEGRFGGALEFDGVDDCVYRQATDAIRDLRQLTVECWFRQDNPEGRQFLVGHDVTYHFDLSAGNSSSLSLYNRGASVANSLGLQHQQIGAGLGNVRLNRWHHLAATFDGRQVCFFLDGVLTARTSGGVDFLLGVPSRGLWIGCYVGNDYWYHGRIDEVRVSDCVRYDPENQLSVGQRVFELPAPAVVRKAVPVQRTTGVARLTLQFQRLHGGNAAGWVSLKAPRRSAAIVGRFALDGPAAQDQYTLDLDVSDQWCGTGRYILGLESDNPGYFAVTKATLATSDTIMAQWEGAARSRRTFEPPVLVPLDVGPRAAGAASRILLLPHAADRVGGDLDLAPGDAADPPSAFGDGWLEYWVDVARAQTYRVYLQYSSPVLRPCDVVIDGEDLHPYHMAAHNRSVGPGVRDALWEYQGTTTLAAGLHWIRLQDVLPEIVGLRLEPVAGIAPAATPWLRYAVPPGDFLARAQAWQAHAVHGQPTEARVDRSGEDTPVLKYSVVFGNTDRTQLLAGDCVRLQHTGTWDLEPFGRLRFCYEGQGAGHVVSLWALDVKGDEKLLWRTRDRTAGTQETTVPISFEGNDVFDPGHVTAICLELDEGHVRADQVNRCAGALAGLVFERRDALDTPADCAEQLGAARQVLAARLAQGALQRPAPLVAGGFRPWTRPVVPEQHPLFSQSQPQPVTRQTLGYELHCTGARDIAPQTLDQFHKFYDFGDVCWPHIGICPQRQNFASDEDYRTALQAMEQRLAEVRSRGLYLFDIWGYVPFDERFPSKFAPEHHEILMRVFGDRFLGYDNGEQDGRYIGGYADAGKHTNRREGWDDFVRWDEQICGDSMGYMNATGSLNFSHYYGERHCRLLGLETAQGLPSDTLMFAFLRGAGKQYGRLLTQATSIWNRFGYNMYQGRKTDGGSGYGYGPHKGCSLSLHKRLFFSSYLGGHSIVGTETSQFTADQQADGTPELSPLGTQHLALRQWFAAHPDRGVMYTPVALMLDFYHGWNMPRHLYRSDKYKIWGKLPYEKGDYLADGLFRFIWPGYEDCSYLRNERGFLTPTPYGDQFDVLTNRCHPSVLQQYNCVMPLGDVEMSPDVVSNLTAFVQNGGDLVISARNAAAFSEEFTGVKIGEPARGCLSCLLADGSIFDEQPFSYRVAGCATATPLLVNERHDPLVTVNTWGRGRVIVGMIDHWMTDPLTYRAPEIVNMEPPYTILHGVRRVLADYFDSFSPVEIEPRGLGITTCCFDDDPQRLMIGLMNHDLFADWQGSLRVRLGSTVSIHELYPSADRTERTGAHLQIPAGEVLILDVRL